MSKSSRASKGVAQATTSLSATAAEIVLLDLYDRPFLHEQGQTVTRGFVEFFEFDEDDRWSLFLRDTEYLHKDSGEWRPDCASDEYCGSIEHASFERYFSGRSPIFDIGLEITCYGIYIFVGPLFAGAQLGESMAGDPWRNIDWPALDTDALSPGPMK